MTPEDGDLALRAARIARALARNPAARLEVPSEPGYYAWWIEDAALSEFQPEVPPCRPDGGVPGWSLVYVGISPRNATSNATLAKRVGTHRAGKVERSTFRFSIAALLPTLDLRLVGTTPNGKKPRFASEQPLTSWIAANAAPTVAYDAKPWIPALEAAVVRALSPPLNGTYSMHPFSSTVAAKRTELMRAARELPPQLRRSEEAREMPDNTDRRPAQPIGSPPPPRYETQRITHADIGRGQVRIPQRAKAAFPAERQDVIVVLRGKEISCRWDPRTGGTKERSGVLHVGVDNSRSLNPDSRLTIWISEGPITLD